MNLKGLTSTLQLFFEENDFLAELQPEIILFTGIPTSCNIPGGSPSLVLPSESKS